MKTKDKAGVAMVVTTLAVAFMGAVSGWPVNTFLIAGFASGGLVAVFVMWGGVE